jgi:hypothetical protein
MIILIKNAKLIIIFPIKIGFNKYFFIENKIHKNT